MHEAAMVKDMLEIVEHVAKDNDIQHVLEIKLVVGQRKAVLPRALDIAFRAYIRNQPLFQDCVLSVKEEEILLCCQKCGTQFHTDISTDSCVSCGSAATILLKGDELYVDSIKGE